jgi:hypothetical protein
MSVDLSKLGKDESSAGFSYDRRPPREDYVRVTVSALGYTFEPAVEYRDGDLFGRVGYKLRSCAHNVAHDLMRKTTEEVYADFDARPTPELIIERSPDAMAACRAVAARIADIWPDRAYFVEVWQEGREGFAQVFQPFGVPRNR